MPKVSKPKMSGKIEVGSRVVVTTVYTVKRIIDGGGPLVLVSCDDEYKDRTVNFRMSELIKLEEPK